MQVNFKTSLRESFVGNGLSGLNPLSANPIKWSNTVKQFVRKPTSCLNMFGHVVGSALKNLKLQPDLLFVSLSLRHYDNLFMANVSILYPLKTQETQRFSSVTSGVKMGILARNQLRYRFIFVQLFIKKLKFYFFSQTGISLKLKWKKLQIFHKIRQKL